VSSQYVDDAPLPRAPVGPIDPRTGRELRPLTLLGHPVLHAPAAEVTDFDDELGRLVDDMFASMYAARGVGLAATQVGVGLRVFVYDCGPGVTGHVVNPICRATCRTTTRAACRCQGSTTRPCGPCVPP